MKKIFLLFSLMLATMAASAQQKGFVCTGDYVNVRTGAGVSFPVQDAGSYPRRMMKGDVLVDLGKRKNGFCLIREEGWGVDERDGWMSARYLKTVILCPTCSGAKVENIDEHEINLIDCRNCKGRGYVK